MTSSACSLEQEAPRRAPTARSIARTRRALGVPQNGFPSWNEAVIYMLTNRARADPPAELAATCTACPGGVTYNVGRPLDYSYDLSRAARFHAASMRLAGSGLQHQSVCKLVANIGQIYPSTCDGSPSCACEGGAADCTCSTTSCSDDSACGVGGRCDRQRGRCYYCKCNGDLCTSTAARVARFGGAYRGENAAAGRGDPRLTFAQWINSTGHRNNLMNSSHRALGTGQFDGSGGCWSNFWVQVFGYAAQTPAIAGGVAYPRSGRTSTTFDFTAVFYDAAGAAPGAALVNIDGSCEPLSLERGVAGHGSYLAQKSSLAVGCHRYYFVFRDSGGALHTFPSQGSYGVGVDDPACAFYDSTRPPLGAGCGCSSDADCDDGNGCTRDRCQNNSCSNAPISGCSDGGPPDAPTPTGDGPSAGDGGGASLGDGGGSNAGDGDASHGDGGPNAGDGGGPSFGDGGSNNLTPGGGLYGSCSAAPGAESTLPAVWLLLLGLLDAARRRRSTRR